MSVEQNQSTTENTAADSVCHEADGCPTEMAVLKREWRRMKMELESYKRSNGFVLADGQQHKLKVRLVHMPESNGKNNWTVLLSRESYGGMLGSIASGYCVARSEYYDRMRYEVDRLRFLIGETDVEPFILDYDPHITEPLKGTT